MKCLPSGRKTGHLLLFVVASVCSNPGTSSARPPPETTLLMAPPLSGANTINPFWFQLAPRPVGASQITCTGPPLTPILFSLPSAKKPIDVPSGDQNG